MEQEGYLFIFISNEKVGQQLWVDDFSLTHQHSPVVQVDDYFPFGGTFNSYQRMDSKKNHYLYNGKEFQSDLGLDWYDYGARMYMSDIGRWGVIDPLGEVMVEYSPYNYTLNNPLNFTDPTGMIPENPYKDRFGRRGHGRPSEYEHLRNEMDRSTKDEEKKKQRKEEGDGTKEESNWNRLSDSKKIATLVKGISQNNAEEKDSYLMTYDDIFKNYPKSNYGKNSRIRKDVEISKIATEVYVEFLHDIDFQRFNSMYPSTKTVLKGDTYYTNYYFYDSDFSRSKFSKMTLFIQVPSNLELNFSQFLNIR